MNPRLPEALQRNIMPVPFSGCWLWTSTLNSKGYGRWKDRQKNHMAHRLVYELVVGPFPQGLQADHLCRVRCCVNPAHIEAVTSIENNRRSRAARGISRKARGKAMKRASREVCPRGHLQAEVGRYIDTRGTSRCKACCREQGKARQKLRAVGA